MGTRPRTIEGPTAIPMGATSALDVPPPRAWIESYRFDTPRRLRLRVRSELSEGEYVYSLRDGVLGLHQWPKDGYFSLHFSASIAEAALTLFERRELSLPRELTNAYATKP